MLERQGIVEQEKFLAVTFGNKGTLDPLKNFLLTDTAADVRKIT